MLGKYPRHHKSQSHRACIWSILTASSGLLHLILCRESWVVPFSEWIDLTVVFIRSTRLVAGITSCALGSHILISDCLIVTCRSCINPNKCFYSAEFTIKDFVLKVITFTVHYSKAQESDTNLQYGTIPLHYILWFNSYLVLPLSHIEDLLGHHRCTLVFNFFLLFL